MPKRNRPIVGLAMGDAAGIGPELVVKALEHPETTKSLDAVVIGDLKIIRKAAEQANSKLVIKGCKTVGEADFSPDVVNVIDLDNLSVEAYATGEVAPTAGKAAVEYTETAVRMALVREIDAIASAPVNKAAMHKAGYDFAGITELLAHLTGRTRFFLVVVFGPIRLFFMTNHVSLRNALEGITKSAVLQKIRDVDEALGDFGITRGSIGISALNPHGGEGGDMGREELDEIIPAVMAARDEGINALGPFPADTIFIRGRKAEFDGILVMYHDQGNIAAKLMGFGAGVTVVTGLPIIRTSVTHGTAFDIAGKGLASAESYIAAITTAGEIAMKRGFVD